VAGFWVAVFLCRTAGNALRGANIQAQKAEQVLKGAFNIAYERKIVYEESKN
jgi:hypothetical protein